MAGGGAGALILFVCPAPLCPPGPIEVGDYSMAQLAPGTFNRNITRIILIKYFRYSFIIILLLIVFNRYFYKFNVEFILKLVNKYLPNKITVPPWLRLPAVHPPPRPEAERERQAGRGRGTGIKIYKY